MSNIQNISSIHDIKETSRRAIQFSYVAMMIASITVVTNFLNGNILSAFLVIGLISSLGLLVWINKKGDPRVARFGLVVLLNIFLTVIAFAEGLKTASTLYFLPLLFAIPFLIDNSRAYKRQLAFYFGITLIAFSICVLFCPDISAWQPISEAVFRQMFITNCICAFVLCAIFASLSIFLERRYAYALLNQINKTEEAMEARTRFLSSMGHELRTPLNGIIGATNLLRRGECLPEQNEYLGILKYCSDHMLGLVNDILDFNKIEAGQLDLHPVECNIKKLLQQSTLPFHNSFEEKKLDFQLVIDEGLDSTVMVDDMRLVQVINNLLSNAIKFTERGFIRLEVKQTALQNGEVSILFSVQDTGIGIKTEDQEKVFGSFWQVYHQTTRKYAGTGLGLTICQRLLGLMNSHLSLESHPGRGSRFSFAVTVPVVESIPKKVLVPELKQGNLEGIRILLAEDNIINSMIAKKILEDNDASVVTVQNGQEALDALQHDAGYHLIFLDLEMPVMDGYTALLHIQQHYPHLPVVAFTAALMDQAMYQRLKDLGFKDCILKPFQMLDIYAKVRKYALPLEMQVA